jgi:8-oxo-dGTP diphosphatase
MSIGQALFIWKFCPVCGELLQLEDDGQSERPHCVRCSRFYYSNPTPAACCFVSDEDGALLLVKRAIEPKRGMWCWPGGFIELGETSEEAALRELEEETGLRGSQPRLIGASTRQSSVAGAVLVLGYVIGAWEGTPIPMTDAADLGFFSEAQRPQLAFEAHRELLAIYDTMGEL